MDMLTVPPMHSSLTQGPVFDLVQAPHAPCVHQMPLAPLKVEEEAHCLTMWWHKLFPKQFPAGRSCLQHMDEKGALASPRRPSQDRVLAEFQSADAPNPASRSDARNHLCYGAIGF